MEGSRVIVCHEFVPTRVVNGRDKVLGCKPKVKDLWNVKAISVAEGSLFNEGGNSLEGARNILGIVFQNLDCAK